MRSRWSCPRSRTTRCGRSDPVRRGRGGGTRAGFRNWAERRLPVVLPGDAHAEWLEPDTPVARLTALLRPYPAGEMQMTAANPAVNSPKNDGPECLEAA